MDWSSVVLERGFRVRSDTLQLSVVLPGHRGAPLITHVLPHLVALSRDLRAPDANCIAVRGCCCWLIQGGVIYSHFVYLSIADQHTQKEDVI